MLITLSRRKVPTIGRIVCPFRSAPRIPKMRTPSSTSCWTRKSAGTWRSTIEYATPNQAARQLTSEGYRNNSIIFPSAQEMKTLEPSLYLGEERSEIVDSEWTRVLSA